MTGIPSIQCFSRCTCIRRWDQFKLCSTIVNAAHGTQNWFHFGVPHWVHWHLQLSVSEWTCHIKTSCDTSVFHYHLLLLVNCGILETMTRRGWSIISWICVPNSLGPAQFLVHVMYGTDRNWKVKMTGGPLHKHVTIHDNPGHFWNAGKGSIPKFILPPMF